MASSEKPQQAHSTVKDDLSSLQYEDGADQVAHELVQNNPKRSWRSYFWDTFDKSPEERAFLFKLDAALLTFASLGYFIKYLDQININNAFVSGMQEDLGLYKNQLNYMTTCWTVGYVIGEIPSNLILTRVRPSIWIPACEVTWATLTILIAKCSNVNQIYVLRFFIGLAESTFYPGMQYIIGSWYRKDELAKRSCIFHVSSAVGSMFSGYLMAAVYRLDGVNGFRGWQWLFIVDTVISLPIAVAGFFFIPDYPATTRAWYFNDRDIALAKERMRLEGRSAKVDKHNKSSLFTKQKGARIFTSWRIYTLVLLYVFFNNGASLASQPAFALWLKRNLKMDVTSINTYPTLTYAVQIISTFAYAWSSDSIFRGARWPPMIFSGCAMIVVNASLAAWYIPRAWHWACYILAGLGGGISGLCFAWAHEICNDDLEERALVTGAMNSVAYAVQAWLPLIVWQQVDAPRYRTGSLTMVGLNVGLIATALTIRHFHRREASQKRIRNLTETSSTENELS